MRLVHQGDIDEGAVAARERLLLRGRLVEGLRPLRLQVERIDEHEQGFRVDRALGQELRDPILGPIRDPGVDPLPCAFGVGQVETLGRCAVVGAEYLDEVLDQLDVDRREQAIRQAKRGFAGGGERLIEVVEGGVQLGARDGEVEDVLDLRQRLSARSGSRHAEGEGDAERREDEILLL